ncbi:GNAT family N-acetyltransferase [Streptomyces sp. NPDC008265]|uniref:GNAT family N-acetyltransferase n=1 Tax=Streptomyces sp. NPDC008265 TaxID=3364824 RepID=UPI0036ED9899
METRVRLLPWSESDFWLLERANEPAMTEHLGGPESPAKLLDRQRRYEALGAREPAAGRMFRIEWLTPDRAPAHHDGPSPAPAVTVGSIGFWEREWRGEAVYETGWAVLPEFQGRGLAAAALTELLAHIGAHGTRDSVHAFPGTDHPASNAVCRRAGFTYLGDVDFAYPPGVPHPSCDWRHRVTPRTGITPSG